MKESWNLIYSGTPKDFLIALSEEALDHPAVKHPYLQSLSAGEFPSMTLALADYAHQYSFYSNHFTEYLSGVISQLSDPQHKELLKENFEEESGDPDASEYERRPHKELFSMFAQKVGVDEEYKRTHPPCSTVLIWRDLFLQKCNTDIEGVGVGAIGIGTEFIVPHVYPYIISAIKKHTDLDESTAFFFELHTTADEEHAEDLNSILLDLAVKPECREALRFGTFSTLNLRKAFWDVMLARAINMPGD